MDKNERVRDYIIGLKSGLSDSVDFNIPDNVINALLDKYANTDLSYDEIVEAIIDDVELYLSESVDKDEDHSLETPTRKEEEKIIEEMAKEEEEEPKKNITINDSDINLMMIANTKSPKELQDVINKIPNLNIDLKSINLDDVQFNVAKNMVFEKYRDSIPQALRDIGDLNLVSIEDYENLSNSINTDYDVVTVDNGYGVVNTYSVDKDFNVEEYKNDDDLVNESDIEMSDSFDSNYVVAHDTDYNKETFNVEDKRMNDEKRFKSEIDSMMPDEVVYEKKDSLEKNNHKVLKLSSSNGLNSEKGSTDTINVVLTIFSLVSILILLILCVLIKG